MTLSQLLIVLVSIYNRQNTKQKKDQVFITFLNRSRFWFEKLFSKPIPTKQVLYNEDI